MAVITPEIQEFIKNNLGWITTISKDGELDLGPKMSLFVLDDTHIAYHERTAGQHYECCTLMTISTTSRSRSPKKRAPRSRP